MYAMDGCGRSWHEEMGASRVGRKHECLTIGLTVMEATMRTTRAAELEVNGRSSMKRAQLIRALRNP